VTAAQKANSSLAHEKRGDQQSEGVDCSPCPCVDIWSTVSTDLGSPVQEGCGAVGVGPEEGHEDDQRAGTPLLQG